MSDQFPTIISIGSNTYDRAALVARAIDRIAQLCTILVRTDVYECPDESGLGSPYYNVLAAVDPLDQTLDILRADFKQIECALGRNEISKPSGVMPIDLDIVIWQGTVVDPRQYACQYFQKGLSLLPEPYSRMIFPKKSGW